MTFLDSLNRSLRNWKAIVSWALVGILIGLLVGLSTPKTYSVKVLVAPEITSRSTIGSLNSIASLAGIRSGTMTMTDAMHPNIYPDVLHSTAFLSELFSMPVAVETKDSLVHTDLYNYIATYNKTPWWKVPLGWPDKIKAWVKGLFIESADAEESEGYEVLDPLRLTKQQESVVNAISNSIVSSVDKKSYLLSIQVTMQDPVVAADLSNAVVERLQGFVNGYRTSREQENLDYLIGLEAQNKKDYKAALNRYSHYVDSHHGIVSNSSKAVEQQLQNEVNFLYQIYNQTTQKLLESKAKVQQETPVLAVVQPGIPPHNGQPSTSRTIIVFMLLGIALRLAWVVFGLDYLFSSLFARKKS